MDEYSERLQTSSAQVGSPRLLKQPFSFVKRCGRDPQGLSPPREFCELFRRHQSGIPGHRYD
jgi:hypothetical protein